MNLKKYTWGLGLEHEMHIFHKPKNSKNKPIKDFLIFDSYAAMNRILDDYDRGLVDVSDDDINREFLISHTDIASISCEDSIPKCILLISLFMVITLILLKFILNHFFYF